jgi:hypothetical protein
MEFLVFIGSGKKSLNHFIGFSLDVVNLILFPYLYILLGTSYFNNGGVFLEPPYNLITLGVIVLCNISYFLTAYFPRVFSHKIKVTALVILAIGIFLNIGMIYQQEAIFSIFNIAIIFLFIMRISQTTDSMLAEKEDKLKQCIKDSIHRGGSVDIK